VTRPTRESDTAGIPRRAGSRRLWLFRLCAVGFSLVPFLLVEIGLRLAGYGHDTRLVVPARQSGAADSYRLNPSVDRAYYGLVDLSGPEPRPFQLPKPPRIYRIVVVGGSSVAGFPYASELSMPRQLELALSTQSSDRQFEVLNAGITAINSFSEVDLVRQAAGCQPDLIVIHSGHNEFYGPGGPASAGSYFSPAVYPLLETMRRQRLFQLGLSLFPHPTESHLLETLPADTAIPLDSRLVGRVEETYRRNLQRSVRAASRARIPLLLTSIPSNVRDLGPMQSIARRDLDAAGQAELAAHQQQADHHLSYREYDTALAHLQAARRLDPGNAILAYREAQCLEAIGRMDEAAAAYERARDLDGCRFRAPGSFRAIVREVAESSGETTFYCDVAGHLQERSKLPVPGHDFFLEHVHYNLEGHWQVALILAEFIHRQVLKDTWRPENVPGPEERDQGLGITPFDSLMGDSITLMMLDIAPLKFAPDTSRHIELLKTRILQTYAELSPWDREIFADLSLTTMQRELLIAMGTGYLHVGQPELAAHMFQTHILRRPWEASGYLGAAEAQQQLNDLDTARGFLDKASKTAPHCPEVHEAKKRFRIDIPPSPE
jgi:tetratricopeptide (TPR) repeat protein